MLALKCPYPTFQCFPKTCHCPFFLLFLSLLPASSPRGLKGSGHETSRDLLGTWNSRRPKEGPGSEWLGAGHCERGEGSACRPETLALHSEGTHKDTHATLMCADTPTCRPIPGPGNDSQTRTESHALLASGKCVASCSCQDPGVFWAPLFLTPHQQVLLILLPSIFGIGNFSYLTWPHTVIALLSLLFRPCHVCSLHSTRGRGGGMPLPMLPFTQSQSPGSGCRHPRPS